MLSHHGTFTMGMGRPLGWVTEWHYGAGDKPHLPRSVGTSKNWAAPKQVMQGAPAELPVHTDAFLFR